MTQLTVARIGNAVVGGDSFPADDEWRKPWQARPRVVVDVDDATLLGDVIAQALSEPDITTAGMHYVPYAIAFWRPEDDAAGVGSRSMLLPVLLDDGSADWRNWTEVKVSQLLAAHERGLIQGDPRRPYAFVLPQVGNGVLPTWHELIAMLDVLRTVVEILALPGGVAASWALLRGRPQEAAEVVNLHAIDWADRGLDPYGLDVYLDEHPWHPADLAAALACSEDSACALLWVLGFAKAPSGVWRREITPESIAMSRIRRLLISTAAPDAANPELAHELEQRLQHLIDTGLPADERDWDDLPWLQPALPGNSASQARTRRGFARILRRLGKGPE
jgi:hypothetical protein